MTLGRRALLGGFGLAGVTALLLIPAGAARPVRPAVDPAVLGLPLGTEARPPRRRGKRLLYDALKLRRGASLRVPRGVTRLEFATDLEVQRGARIVSNQNLLTLVVKDDLILAGDIRTAGDLVLVSKASDIPSARSLSSRSGRSSAGIRGRPGKGRKLPTLARNWKLTGNLVAGDRGLKLAQSTQTERSGRTLFLEASGNVQLGSGGAALVYQVEDGDDGASRTGCTARGGNGKQGGKIDISAAALLLLNVRFTGGNGGSGGNVTGTGCSTGQTNSGGHGGKPGEFRLIATGFGLQNPVFIVNGTARIDGFSGGDGGDATTTGSDGDPGQSPKAEAGGGADVRGALNFSRIRIGPNGLFSVNIGDGGDGGDGSGTGGNGVPKPGCTPQNTPAKTPAPHGGDGKAKGGDGGDVDVRISGDGGGINARVGFNGGTGGLGTTRGGNGSAGADCPRVGGDGGNGGQATDATAGAQGTSNIHPPGGGSRGVSRRGGNGGKGGDADPTVPGSQGGNGGLCGAPLGAGGGGGAGAVPGLGRPNCP